MLWELFLWFCPCVVLLTCFAVVYPHTWRFMCCCCCSVKVVAYCATKYKRGETTLAEFAAASRLLHDGSAGLLLLELSALSVVDAWGDVRSPSRPATPTAEERSRTTGVASVADLICPTPVVARALSPLLSRASAGDPRFTHLPLMDIAHAVTPSDEFADDGWMLLDIHIPRDHSVAIADYINDHPDTFVMWASDFF